MDRAAATLPRSPVYVRWEEVSVSCDKGRREVHYYLKRKDGASDLAVIGTEKSLRHMSYHHTLQDSSFLLRPWTKLRSRREVVDWLDSIVSGYDFRSSFPSEPLVDDLGSTDACKSVLEGFQTGQLLKSGQSTKDFLWVGTPWCCRRRRKHYQSFRRNGVTISVHDFIYVLAEEDKRLVAYLDDMYEDSRGNRMVVVRWFHKIDEVGFVLPHSYNDREIFFSLCLQDLSIECIDGLAVVLSPQHYDKLLKEATRMRLEPFVCCRQFENDDVKAFDITEVKGYWKQQILKSLSFDSQPNSFLKGLAAGTGLGDDAARPKKRLCHSKDYIENLQPTAMQDVMVMNDFNSLNGLEGGTEMSFVENLIPKPPLHLNVGCHVEVLAQDSGIKGCWFRAVVIKQHKNKIKVRYQDLKDADNEYSSLEEWILPSKVAVPDNFGVRIRGRTVARPTPPTNEFKLQWAVNIGAFVDVWWYDGWWEGIVLRKQSEDRILVYFPGEKRVSAFKQSDLRYSQEWLANEWKTVQQRPDLVMSILSDLDTKQHIIDRDSKPDQAELLDAGKLPGGVIEKSLAEMSTKQSNYSRLESADQKVDKIVRDLSKDNSLGQLRWSTSRKRCSRSTCGKLNSIGKKGNSLETNEKHCFKRILMPPPSTIDHEMCKPVRQSLFGSPVVSHLTSLVMSR